MRRRCAVLGDPVEHSLSPVLHRAGYAALDLDLAYEAIRVPDGGLPGFLGGLGEEWRGLSLTMPHKRAALELADTVTDRARLAGAANTLVLDDDGVRADNTDLPGAAAALRERYDGPVTEVSILGAGATAASVGLALCDLGARTVRLLARSVERAAETRDVVRRHPAAPTVRVEPLDAEGPLTGDLVVSTVPVVAQTPTLVDRCLGVPVVFEVLYDPWPTPLASAAVQDGRVLVAGLDLLVHQAVLQFALFTGHRVDPDVLRRAGEDALAARWAAG